MQSDLVNNKIIEVQHIQKAYQRIKKVVTQTPLQENLNLSTQYDCTISLKREDLQIVRSYKIRGAYNKISSLNKKQQAKGVVCASAGNHAQGVAYACNKLKIQGKIVMPTTTPEQKVKQVKMFGKDMVEVILSGDTFDDAYAKALELCERENRTFVHPFNDEDVISGQGTVGLEILMDTQEPIDYIFVAIGGGGLASGLGSYVKQISPNTKIIGVEPTGAAAMKASFDKGELVTLDKIEKFIDGAAVKCVGDKTFEICRQVIDEIKLVPEGKVCSTILKLYNEEAIIAEPAGALSIAVLDFYKEEIKGKNVVCLISGGNNDITRTEEIKERSLLYEGRKHYFIITFPQRAGALREFLVEVLGVNDDITHFEYTKKNSREKGPALVGIQTKSEEDFKSLIKRIDKANFGYRHINNNPDLFSLLI